MLGYAGGSVEIDEHVEDCARRELFEGMGIVAKKLEFSEPYVDKRKTNCSIWK